MAWFRPRNGGQYCVGRRMKFRSCNSEACSKHRRDFREEQCAAFDGRHFNINGLPPNVRWVPKYSGSKTFVSSCFPVAVIRYFLTWPIFLSLLLPLIVLTGYRFSGMLYSRCRSLGSFRLFKEAWCLFKKKKALQLVEVVLENFKNNNFSCH